MFLIEFKLDFVSEGGCVVAVHFGSVLKGYFEGDYDGMLEIISGKCYNRFNFF